MAQDKIVTRTKSGDIVTINDAYAGMPVETLVTDINPIQDLHGYDKPWSGGNGKNKFETTATSQTISGVTLTVNNDGTVKANGTATADISVLLGEWTADGSRVIGNGCPSGGSTSTYRLFFGNIGADTGSGSTANEPASGTSCPLRLLIYSGYTANNLVFKPMIRLATETDATFAPYSNICPISGHTECVTSVSGVNVWDEEWEVGGINITTGGDWNTTDRIRSKNKIKVLPNTVYNAYSGSANFGRVCFYDSAEQFISSLSYNYTSIKNASITTPYNAYFMRFDMTASYGTTYNNDISINYPSTDHDYHAYNGTTYTTDLGRTVYGGTLDVVSGVLTVERAMVDLGDLSWAYNSVYHYFTTQVANRAIKANNIVSDRYAVTTEPFDGNQQDGEIKASGSNLNIFVSNYSYTDTTAFKNAMVGSQLCYELATPQTYQLTPTEVALLLGTNNVWTDCGEVEVTYITDQSVLPLKIYSGTSVAGLALLPSPVELNPTFEMIWSENTGRAQSGTNKAKMIGNVVAEKKTYNIKWGVLTDAEVMQIKTKLPAGFFYFGMGITLAEAKSVATKYYRSEIAGNYLPIGNNIFWKDVQVSVIEQ